MKLITKLASLSLAAILAGCGGGSTGGNNDDTPAFGRATANFELLPVRPTLLSNRSGYPVDTSLPFATELDVRITGDNGNPAPITTIASLGTSNSDIVSVNGGRFSCTQILSDGRAKFTLIAGASAGVATLSASVDLPFTPGTIDRETGECKTSFPQQYRSVSKNFAYTVSEGPAPTEIVRIAAERPTLPINPNPTVSVPDASSPYVTKVDVSFFTPFGAPASVGSMTLLSLSPDIALLSTEAAFTARSAQATVAPIVGGRGFFYVHSLARSGNADVRVQGVAGSVNFIREFRIVVGNDSGQGVSSIQMTSGVGALYVSGSNGRTSAPISARLLNDAGNNVATSTAGVNNVLFEIVNPAGESLTGSNAAGSLVEGSTLRVRAVGGLASVNLRSAARQGLVVVKATADRQDNNVDNGIQVPVIASRPVAISDGRLFDITITSPRDTLVNEGITVTTGTGENSSTTIRGFGQYRSVMSIIATDRQGNPVLPGTPIEFGVIDGPVDGYPQSGPGTFLITGGDGDPTEGGTQFNAPTGRFRTAGGGAGPGDTLVIFAEQDPANRDLESARTVARVNTETSLDIAAATRFNLNDDSNDTGTAVNRGPVLPYVIGRATIGTILNRNAVTNEFGVATTEISYPVSRVGHAAIVWARGVGDTPPGQVQPEVISDVQPIVFAAAVGGKLTASPGTIPGGRRSLVQVCLEDTNTNPVTGVRIAFSVTGASGTFEGATGGTLGNATGLDGCASAYGTFVTSATGTPEITFSVGSGIADVKVKISPISGAILFALPDVLGGSGGRVTLRLVDGSGNPIPGVQVGGSCAGGTGTAGAASLIGLPGVTNENGETTADISANLNSVGTAPGTATCTFTAAGLSATVSLRGLDICTLNFSPRPAGCPVVAPPTVVNFGLAVNIRNQAGSLYAPTDPAVQVVGNAGGLTCSSAAAGFSGTCTVQIARDTVVTLTASPGVGSTATFCRWTGEVACTSTSATVQVPMDAAKTCVATFSTAGAASCPLR